MNSLRGKLAILFVCLLAFGSAASAKDFTLKAHKLDGLAGAKTISAGRSYVVNQAENATATANEPVHNCKASTGGSVWFKLKVDRELSVMFDTDGSNLKHILGSEASAEDTVMTLYYVDHGTPATYNHLHQMTCSDDTGPYTYSRIGGGFTLVPGYWYYLQVSAAQTDAMLLNSSFRLNVNIVTLLDNSGFEDHQGDPKLKSAIRPWKLSGAVTAFDEVDCLIPASNLCGMRMHHDTPAATTLKQTIVPFRGIALDKGMALSLSADVEYIFEVDLRMRLKVYYTDGTVQTLTTTTINSGTRSPEYGSLELEALPITKPVAKVVVEFREKSAGIGYTQINDVVLRVGVSVVPTRSAAAMPLPLPQSAQ